MSEDDVALRWLKDVEDHDFDAALAYLSLRFNEVKATSMVHALRKARVTTRRANDILRACDRQALSLDDPGVRRDFAKAVAGKKLSPVLFVVGKDIDIADGYHRVSLAYHLNPFGDVPLRIGNVD